MRIDTDLNGGVVPVRLSLRLSPLSLLPLPIVLAPLAESWGLAVHERGPVTFRSCFLKGVEGGLGRSCRTLFLCGGEFRRHSHRSQHGIPIDVREQLAERCAEFRLGGWLARIHPEAEHALPIDQEEGLDHAGGVSHPKVAT